MSDRDDQLREMAKHRGLKLVKSRRRKEGGDFGLYGLKDAGGKQVFGFGGDRLTATDAEIEAYLRDALRSDWAQSAEATPAAKKRKKDVPPAPKPEPKARRRAPAPPAPPPPPPPPRFEVELANILRGLPEAKDEEVFTDLLARPGLRLERIVSRGQATPEDAPMVQDQDEWVLLLQGAAAIRIEDSEEVSLRPGDTLLIARGQKHWVTWTASDRATVWLALHLG